MNQQLKDYARVFILFCLGLLFLALLLTLASCENNKLETIIYHYPYSYHAKGTGQIWYSYPGYHDQEDWVFTEKTVNVHEISLQDDPNFVPWIKSNSPDIHLVIYKNGVLCDSNQYLVRCDYE